VLAALMTAATALFVIDVLHLAAAGVSGLRFRPSSSIVDER
jgi:hypothetical protein